MDIKDRIRGGMIGLLVGDALGVPYEFHARESIPAMDEIEFEPPAAFRRAHAGTPAGTYSDDGAQALILLDSLLERGRFDAAHFAGGLCDWYDRGSMAVDGRVFDVGIQTADAIRLLRRGVEPLLAGGADEYSNGNGALMRVLPLALWHRGTDVELVADAFDQSAVTHGHRRSQICCALYCLWARRIVENAENPWAAAVETFGAMFPEETIERTELDTRIFPKNADYEIRGGGYVVDSLRAARVLAAEDSYEMTVKRAVALGDDTDTTACIAGGIAGLIHGHEAIPARWRAALRGRELYEPPIEKLLALY
ncbi:MAG: ADP-ribosylglycohydrolase family protein [Acidobacteria bacterium]|nr:ADP-ribosylglycohydrolase family protein [Acidobacteriota bacterium]